MGHCWHRLRAEGVPEIDAGMVPARGWAGCVVTQDALRTLTLMAPAAEHHPAAGRGRSHSPAAPEGIPWDSGCAYHPFEHPRCLTAGTKNTTERLPLASPPMCHLIVLAALDVGCMAISERSSVDEVWLRR